MAMKRRSFLRNSTLGTVGLGWLGGSAAWSDQARSAAGSGVDFAGIARNIIFLVSDGMSAGTLQMADLLTEQKFGHAGRWMQLYRDPAVRRALMDTASADSYVTDSAAASSAWGGGVRVPNGSLNIGADGKHHHPIWQKFRRTGKAVGCVTTVPITHATPAGFCVNHPTRKDQAGIAVKYLDLRFDVMLGGGTEFFDSELREDDRDLFADFQAADFQVARTRSQLAAITGGSDPVLGVFHENGLPYDLDHRQDDALLQQVPTLAEMSRFAIERLRQHDRGFVLQIEGGKVDWAAHANDTAALLYDQLAFDEAVGIAVDFAREDRQTLLIVTTDHGNANPGIIGTANANPRFDRVQGFRQTNEWVLKGLSPAADTAEVIDRLHHAQGITITAEEAQVLVDHLRPLSEEDRRNPYKLPFAKLAEIQKKYTAVGWAGDDHSGDYVELTAWGPGSQLLPPFVKNTDLHRLMLDASGVTVS